LLSLRRPIVLGTTDGIAAEPNRVRMNSHVTTLAMAIPDATTSAVRFFTVCCGWTIHPTANATDEVKETVPS